MNLILKTKVVPSWSDLFHKNTELEWIESFGDIKFFARRKRAPRELRADYLIEIFEIYLVHRFNVNVEGWMIVVTPSKI